MIVRTSPLNRRQFNTDGLGRHGPSWEGLAMALSSLIVVGTLLMSIAANNVGLINGATANSKGHLSWANSKGYYSWAWSCTMLTIALSAVVCITSTVLIGILCRYVPQNDEAMIKIFVNK